ncbi:MAG: type II toxin-antitoxin system RelE/ParE family toxin [Coriobacteriia bacterium]|nr:type II toxin-antitoxin system RelE/ParE family toxin [Coriobacteriia bacterium]
MANSVEIKLSAAREIEGIPIADRREVVERIGRLAEDPRPRGCEKLAGGEHYRVRQGDYRIVYTVEDGRLVVWVVKVGHRRDVYRRM